MPRTEPFERHAEQYERWFEENEAVYRAEVAALDRLVPATGDGLEVGVGSGRFAAPLGIEVGVDPARAMLERAVARGIDGVLGVAEALPFRDGAFDVALIVTTICFVEDVPRTLAEARRVLGPEGAIVVGYVDENSPVGRIYREKQDENPFYREAEFVSTEELLAALRGAGFAEFEFVQTVYHWPAEVGEPEPVEEGYGEGSFVGVRATPG